MLLTANIVLVWKCRCMGLLRTVYHVLQLKRHQWKERRELKKIQLKKLKATIRYAYENVPYYHQLFDSVKIKPEDIRNEKDLQKIPMTTKNDVQGNYNMMIAIGIDLSRCEIDHTSGSTGIPLRIPYDQKTLDYARALVVYSLHECGCRWRDEMVRVSARRPREHDWRSKRKQVYMQGLDSRAIIKKLQQMNSDVIITYPSVLTTLAMKIGKGGIQEVKPRLIFTMGETLTQYCRDLVRSTFGIEVHDNYGAAEFNRLAFECNEHKGLHIITDCAVLEFLRDGEAVDFDEEGEIVVTGLYHRAMPFIRYQIGDAGIPIGETCECGRNWPLIKSIEGRMDDFVVLPSGKIISPNYFSLNIGEREEIPGIVQYQIIQEKKDRFIVLVEKRNGFDKDSVKKIKEQIKEDCFGENVTVDVQVIKKIPRERTGKLKKVVSSFVCQRHHGKSNNDHTRGIVKRYQ